MLLEKLQRDNLECLFVSCRNDHWASDPLFGCVLPGLRADAPSIARGEAWESMLGNGCHQVVPLGESELQELPCYDAANRMQAPVIPVGIAAPVPVPPSQRVLRALLQILA